MEIFKTKKPDNQIEYIDSIELLYSKHEWITFPVDINTFTIKGIEKVQTINQIKYNNEEEIWGKEKIENVVEEKDQLIILSQVKEPLQMEVKPENKIQAIDQMEIFKTEKPDNQIEYIDSIELLYSSNEWITVPPSDTNTFIITQKNNKLNNLNMQLNNLQKESINYNLKEFVPGEEIIAVMITVFNEIYRST